MSNPDSDCNRVIQVTVDDLDDRACGKSRSVSTLVDVLASRGDTLRVVSPHHGRRRWLVRGVCYALALVYRPLGKVARHYFYSEPFIRSRLAAEVADAEAAGRPYVVHARDFVSVLAYERVRPRPSLGRVVLTVHCLASHADELLAEGHLRPGGPFERRIRAEEARALALADAVVVQTTRGRDALLAAFPGLQPDKARVIPNPVEIVHLPLPARRRDLGIPEDAFVVFSAARMTRQKRVDLLIAAFAQLAAGRPDAWLVIAGDGWESGRVEAAAARSGAAERILLLGRRADVPDLIALSDVVALTSSRESFGRILAEGALVGRPLVAFECGAWTDALEDGVSGYLVPFGAVAAFAARLEELAAEPSLRARMGARGRERSVGLDAAAVADAYEALYTRVCGMGEERAAVAIA